jgi:enoyl-CoA hydratase/carnithine racemase
MTATTYQTMRVETDDRLPVITIDRPEARNALSLEEYTLHTGIADEMPAAVRRDRGSWPSSWSVPAWTPISAPALPSNALAQSLLYTTADTREGAEAFLGKRAPHFQGK